MGEVYRAEDLLLEQRVALKLLPVELAADPDRISRLLTEVRLARQVSHPNVCRVWDVGEADGHRFLTMELIEGEDLAALLRQVGRFPGERGLDIARQLCAGLAAAHDRGVVHRDLKPANVLVDRNGRVHVTDFGLALAGAAEGPEALAGTPGYMAPEQLAGRAATARSDLYALGVVLYELFTGQRPYRATSPDELRRRIAEEAPRPPSEVVSDLDPALERVILRCLERDPESRPSSALAVAGALPGADPLAAALAAGETPSPEMVAAAGGEGGLEPRAALALGAVAVAAVALAAVAASFSHIVRFAPLDKPPSYLVERSRELLAELGHTAPAHDDGHSWPWNDEAIDWLRRTGRGAATWRPLATGRVPGQTFVYRQSPQEFRPAMGFAVLSWGEPALHVPGEARVELERAG
jgi:serine/threonine-protein kinase